MSDIFSDPNPWTDIDHWNRSALALHDEGGIHRYEPDRFRPTYELWTIRREGWLPRFPWMRHYEKNREGDGRGEG